MRRDRDKLHQRVSQETQTISRMEHVLTMIEETQQKMRLIYINYIEILPTVLWLSLYVVQHFVHVFILQ